MGGQGVPAEVNSKPNSPNQACKNKAVPVGRMPMQRPRYTTNAGQTWKWERRRVRVGWLPTLRPRRLDSQYSKGGKLVA